MGFVILKDIIAGPFNYVRQNGSNKISIESVRGNDGRRGGIFPPINFDFKTLSISNRMSPFEVSTTTLVYEKHICPEGITYNPHPEGCEGGGGGSFS